MHSSPVLVTGSTGYVGGRLVPLLIKNGHRLRVMGRSLSKLQCRPWAAEPGVELVQADVMDGESLKRALDGCRAAYYLVHSMNPGTKNFSEADRKAALNMADAAKSAGVERIIYLGGLGADESDMSEHLRSRAEVADILQSGRVPTTFLRAAVILGSGSASFELLRYLVDRLPVMISPRWVRTACQPIAIRNVLHYLKGCLEHEETTGLSFDIGGPDVLTYQRLMEIYAEEARLPRRLIIPVPVLTPRLSSYWLHLVTPVPTSLAKPLVEGLRTPVVCREKRIQGIIPQELLSCRRAIRYALENTYRQRVETCWFDTGHLRVPEWVQCGDAPYAGGTFLECGYRIIMKATAEEVWRPIQKIGGRTGWYFGDRLWALRGLLDRLMGGIGSRRGRRHPETIYPGDALDFWRVTEVDPPHRLQLLAEMKTPGQAVLEFKIRALGGGVSELQQLSRFLPKGFLGILYWYMLYPLHQWVFRGMLKGIRKAVGKPIVSGPDRFAPRMAHVCAIGPGRENGGT